MNLTHWPLIKYIEFLVAVYALSVGVLFILNPASLDAPVYDPWQAVGPSGWGSILIATSAAHFCALWLNGRKPQISWVVRACANLLHLYVSLHFSVFFIMGNAPWGSLTFIILMCGLLIPLFLSAFNQARTAIHGR